MAADDDTKSMISMRMSDKLKAEIQAIADAEDRTFAAQIHRALREWLDQQPRPEKKGAKR